MDGSVPTSWSTTRSIRTAPAMGSQIVVRTSTGFYQHSTGYRTGSTSRSGATIS
jgi:hypothetical protein